MISNGTEGSDRCSFLFQFFLKSLFILLYPRHLSIAQMRDISYYGRPCKLMRKLRRIDEHGDSAQLLNRIKCHYPVGGIDAAQAHMGSFLHPESSKVIRDQLGSLFNIRPCIVSLRTAEDHPVPLLLRLPFQ